MATRRRIKRIRVLARNTPFLASASTHQNGRFQKNARLARLADIRQAVLRGLARLAKIRQVVLRGLADIRQAVLRGLTRLAKGKFGKCYANLASLANLASVG
jgi:hypothetical protein